MKNPLLSLRTAWHLLATTACFLVVQSTVALEIPYLFDSDTNGRPNRIYWQTEPGVRYDLLMSDNLDGWSRVNGYPLKAEGLAMGHSFDLGPNGFFMIGSIDEKPPVVVSQWPVVDGFAVGRFADLGITLSDDSGMDPASVRLTVGTTGPLRQGAPGLAINGSTVTYNPGDTALGAWGETVTATLVVADTLGNSLTHTWSFRVETQAIVAHNVIVFGSPEAQQAGQLLDGDSPTADLASRFPDPEPTGEPEPPAWSIASVEADRIMISYTAGQPPAMAADTLACNLTPSSVDQVFYRKIVSTSDDPSSSLLTLFTEDVPLEQFIQRGSASISQDTVVYETDAGGNIVGAVDGPLEAKLGSIGPDLSGEVLWNGNGATVLWDEARWQLTPTIQTSLEIEDFKLERFNSTLKGNIESALVPGFNYNTGATLSGTKQLASDGKLVFLDQVGVVPVWLDVKFNLAVDFSANASGESTMSGGMRHNADFGFGGTYTRGASPAVVWNGSAQSQPARIVPFQYNINGSGGAEIGLTPRVEIHVFGLADVQANMDPRFGFTGEAVMTGGSLESADWSLYSRANLNLGMAVLGIGEGSLPSASYPLYSSRWAEVYPENLQIKGQPQSTSVGQGGGATLDVVAVGPGNPGDLKFQWYHKGLPIPGRTESHLSLTNITQGMTGDYFVVVSLKDETLESDIATVGFAPDGFALIPAGTFTMGDTFAEGATWERPVHTVNVSAFYMAKHETTTELWESVRAWGLHHGYTDLPAGNGLLASKGGSHPVHLVSWYDAVKWCNARSQMDGLAPGYTVDGAVFKTGTDAGVSCDFAANGYRLPTEAEWEKAARGGLSGKRFPWGNTINHSHANYHANGNAFSYDTSAHTSFTYHPTYEYGDHPFSSPVGSFAPNGYGLYDMAGNMWEWCWDWHGSTYYKSSPANDPQGPATGVVRVYRGGGWKYGANHNRAATRGISNPGSSSNGFGFRVARSSAH